MTKDNPSQGKDIERTETVSPTSVVTPITTRSGV
jgi:hypothetical protein